MREGEKLRKREGEKREKKFVKLKIERARDINLLIKKNFDSSLG